MDVLFALIFILLGIIIGVLCGVCIILYRIKKECEFIEKVINELHRNYKINDCNINENRKTLEFIKSTLKILLLTEQK